MKIDNLKELEAVIKVCRKHGVREITVDGISLKIDELQEQTKESGDTKEDLQTPQYTEEQILMWSSTAAELG